MTKVKLGNDFTDESGEATDESEESDEKTSDEESDDEKDNSGDSDNTKKPIDNEADDSKDNKDDESEDEDSKDASFDDASEDKESNKDKILQGLLDTEKNLEKDVGDVDSKIAAAKQRISEKRKNRRDKRDLVETIEKKFSEINEEDSIDDDLSDIDSETLKILDRFTKSKGLIPKSELQKMNYQSQHEIAQDAFYASHPEYLPENDPDDVLYKAIKNELAQFAAPVDAKLIPRLFEKAHKLVVDQYPDKFKNSNKSDYKGVSDDQKNRSIRIKMQGIGSKSSSGGGAGGEKYNSNSKKTFSQEQIRALEDGGWSQEEIKSLIN